MSQTVQSLFTGAADAGVLGAKALNAIDVEDLGAQIQAGLGLSPDDVQASEVTLVNVLVDDSGSLQRRQTIDLPGGGKKVIYNAELVREGYNQMLDALTGTKQKDGILAHCRYLNGTVLYPYARVVDAVRMDSNNYDPYGGTPLYDESLVMLATAAAKYQEFADNGIPARTITVIITDGADAGSNKRASDVAAVVSDLLKTEQHIVIGMGIDDSELDQSGKPIPKTGTDFKKVFKSMGIQDRWILTPGNTPGEIRRAFAMVSQSAVRASQAGAFSKTAMGGFAA